MSIKTSFALVAIAVSVSAQASLYAQCGGQTWKGTTTCVSGAVCTVVNQYYSQCLPGSASASSTPLSSSHTSTTPVAPSSSPSSTSSTPPASTPTSVSGYYQAASGSATFTHYSGCNQPACGISASGYSAAISQLSFGSADGLGPGDACGRCFALTASFDPYSPSYTGPFQSIIVKVTDLCPAPSNEAWCGQSQSSPKNQFGAPVHFDICEDTGGAAVFFPSGHGALQGAFQEVPCSGWSGSDGAPLWNGACLGGESAPLWPGASGCGNKGSAP